VAQILGGLGTSHVPAIGKAIAMGLQAEPYWQPFFSGFPPAHRWLAKARPDVAVVFYNDHGLNFFLDKMPTFAIGAAAEYCNADEGWGLPVSQPYRGDTALSWRLIEHLVEADFDVTTCQEMLVDHAVCIPMELFWPGAHPPPVRIVPIAINTVQHPLPSARRCLALGRAVGAALAADPSDARVVVIGSGGLSHQLDGARAGFLNPDFDRLCLKALVSDPEALAAYSTADLVELAGSQGVELLSWIAMRGALGAVTPVHQVYHLPISNTAAAMMVLENRAAA